MSNLLTSLFSATDEQLQFLQSAFYRGGGAHDDYNVIKVEIDKRRQSANLREAIVAHELKQMETDCEGPHATDFAASLSRVKEKLRLYRDNLSD